MPGERRLRGSRQRGLIGAERFAAAQLFFCTTLASLSIDCNGKLFYPTPVFMGKFTGNEILSRSWENIGVAERRSRKILCGQGEKVFVMCMDKSFKITTDDKGVQDPFVQYLQVTHRLLGSQVSKTVGQ